MVLQLFNREKRAFDKFSDVNATTWTPSRRHHGPCGVLPYRRNSFLGSPSPRHLVREAMT